MQCTLVVNGKLHQQLLQFTMHYASALSGFLDQSIVLMSTVATAF